MIKKNYSLSLQNEMKEEIKKISHSNGNSILETIRSFIRIGLYLHKMKELDPKTEIIIKSKEKDHLVIF